MRLTLRDLTVTALMTTLLALYCWYIALEGFPLLWGVPEMAGVGLALGCVSWSLVARQHYVQQPVALSATIVSIAAGVAALVMSSEPVLTIFMASIGVHWLRGLYLRSGSPRPVRRLHTSP